MASRSQPSAARALGVASIALSRSWPDWGRWSYTAALALYGAAVGGFAVVSNLLGRTPVFLEPRRLDATEAVFIYGAGIATGAALAVPIAYWAHGGWRFLAGGRHSLGLPQWSVLVAGYPLFYPLLMGGLFLPFALMFLAVYSGAIEPGNLFYASADTLFLSPLRGLAIGAQFLFSALWAGLFFGVGAVVMDRVSTIAHPRSGQFLWATSLALTALAAVVAAFTPASLLARLG
ncbi:MAG: hypothetical protein IH956_02525 [Chloroflexi bacterium]|nr:hypothetical protein [Chloroflexota bacterium]